MKNQGPKSLIQFGKECLINRQIRIIEQCFDEPEIVVVLGYGHDEIVKKLNERVKIVFNPDYQNTNIAYSTAIGMQKTTSDSVLVVGGDLFFGKYAIKHFVGCNETTVLLNTGECVKGTVGVNVVEEQATYFSHSLPCKWTNMVFLCGRERILFEKLAMMPKHIRKFSHEIFNMILEDERNHFDTILSDNPKIISINAPRDIIKARPVI